MPTVHHARPTARPYCGAAALVMVRLLVAFVAGSTSGYSANALLASMPARKIADATRLAPSRPRAPKNLAATRPPTAMTGNAAPQGRAPKFVRRPERTKNVAAVPKAVSTTLADHARAAMRRALVW